MSRIPRAALLNDLSGLGRCALSVSIPTLSALGVQPCPVPTALLSAHTGFPGAVMEAQTDFLSRALAHYEASGTVFDGVSSGYLGSTEQADAIGAFLVRQRNLGCGVRLVDPAMADHGRLYRGVSAQMPKAMARLCAHATLITPNHTEACLLTGLPYTGDAMSEEAAQALAKALLALGCDAALITGLHLEGGRWANLLIEGDTLTLCPYAPLPAAFPGTGDLFAAAMLGYLLGGNDAGAAMARATALVRRAMEATLARGVDPLEGVVFEPMLGAFQTITGFALERQRIP